MKYKELLVIGISAILVLAGLYFNLTWLIIGAYVISGFEAFRGAVEGITEKNPFDEELLMTVASLGAIYCGEYVEAVAVMLFFSVGEMLEDRATDSSKEAIEEMLNFAPEFARRVNSETGSEETIDPANIEVGDLISVKPGEKIPVDGVIVSGESAVDTATLTGESMPEDVKEGVSVLAGSINLSGAIRLEATKKYADSAVADIMKLVESASEGKSKAEKFVTKFAKVYTPIVILMATLIAVLPTLIFKKELSWGVLIAAKFLVISCPCALIISVPLAFFAGMGKASRIGMLVKGGNYLEQLSHVESIFFDKTGTLTSGRFDVVSVEPTDGVERDELLMIAKMCERYSEHPMAKAISEYEAEEEKFSEEKICELKTEEIAGRGNIAYGTDIKIACGNIGLMNNLDIEIPEADKDAVEEGSFVYVARNGKYMGRITVADIERKDAKETVNQIKKMGIRDIRMLTGDKKETAGRLASKIGIESYEGELLPADKVKALSQAHGISAYVGDGINDAPVIARADVGIAMGALGSDIAAETADVVNMHDDISGVWKLIKLSKKTVAIAKTNIVFAVGVKVAIMILAAIGIASMWMAVFADVGVSIICALNSGRILKMKI